MLKNSLGVTVVRTIQSSRPVVLNTRPYPIQYYTPYTPNYNYVPIQTIPTTACAVNVKLSRSDANTIARGGTVNVSGVNQCGQPISLTVGLRSESSVYGMGNCATNYNANQLACPCGCKGVGCPCKNGQPCNGR